MGWPCEVTGPIITRSWSVERTLLGMTTMSAPGVSCACDLCAKNASLRRTHNRWLEVFSILDERQRRLYAAEKAANMGHGGITRLAQMTGLSERTVRRGLAELEAGGLAQVPGQVRRPGGGLKWLEALDATVVTDLEALLGETTAGDPMRLLKWTTKSTRSLARALSGRHHVSHTTVHRLLRALDYSLWGDTKAIEGRTHPQRDAQFRYLHEEVKRCRQAKIPVISVDTKKKELVGNFHNPGRRWRQQEQRVNAYDFPSLADGVAYPYGIFDEEHNAGFVNVGLSHDTAEFAVESIARWWRMLGCRWYPRARHLLVTADGGGSNSSRGRLWKYCLQEFADHWGLTVTVCHYPPGTSKWNKIEHRLFSHISITWRGAPLTNYETIINFIGSTTTTTGLKVKAQLDTYAYEIGQKVSDEQMEHIRLSPHETHPKWNYTINPR
jgi:hypothetical protein